MSMSKGSTTSRVMMVVVICGVYAYLVFSPGDKSRAQEPSISAASAEAITRRCAVEAGVDPDAKGHKITSA